MAQNYQLRDLDPTSSMTIFGSETPQAEIIFLTFGELMFCPTRGSFTNSQKQGCCAFKLLQQATDGVAPLTRNTAHGNNSCALQVTAFVIWTLSITTITKTHIAMKENAFFIISE
ncbi:hypothetical protein L2E82_18564 [Cichorium intybus]|uniref:Uncharacterized protein n=1 Tax=Cichorium intybus TaxID=13427 RepID=A0ACB9FBX7_CICIN|nr:hypothetical protein L2E82_18564 [Cichorium intybus]